MSELSRQGGPLALPGPALYVPVRPPSNRRQLLLHVFFHWFFHTVTPWVIGVARADHNWIFPIAFAIAFSESFVGVSFIIPGTFMLITLGGVIGASHISVIPAWAGAVIG